MKARVVVHRADGVSEIVRVEEGEVAELGEATWTGYAIFRKDGWPLCPCCGEDELWSGNVYPDKPTIESIVSCLYCHWKPPVKDGAR